MMGSSGLLKGRVLSEATALYLMMRGTLVQVRVVPVHKYKAQNRRNNDKFKHTIVLFFIGAQPGTGTCTWDWQVSYHHNQVVIIIGHHIKYQYRYVYPRTGM
jgi:hypothetical protein